MNSKFFLPVFLFVALLIGGSYYYLYVIKQVCPGQPKERSAAEDTLSYEDTVQLLQPLTFGYNSEEPVLGNGFDGMRTELLRKLGPSDTLRVLGTYYNGELDGEELGYSRAKHVKSLLVDYFDSNRIQVEASYDAITEAGDSDLLEAFQFNIVSSNPSEAPEPKDSSENVLDVPATEIVSTTNEATTIYFQSGSVKKILTEEDNATLDQLVADLKTKQDYTVKVEGHTDINEGGGDISYQLGRKRAWAIKKMLWDMGLEHQKIITSSQGDLAPAKDNDTEEGRAYNRRVEVTITTD